MYIKYSLKEISYIYTICSKTAVLTFIPADI